MSIRCEFDIVAYTKEADEIVNDILNKESCCYRKRVYEKMYRADGLTDEGVAQIRALGDKEAAIFALS